MTDNNTLIENFLTNNIITRANGANLIQVFSEEPADPPPDLHNTDVAYYRVGDIPWRLVPLPEGETLSSPLLSELQFLESIGGAIQHSDGRQWYYDQDMAEKLYGQGGIFNSQSTNISEQSKRMASLFKEIVLPAYAAMVDQVANLFPDSIYQGSLAREQKRAIQLAIHDLEARQLSTP